MPLQSKLGEANVEIVARLDRLEKDFKDARKKTDVAAKKMDKSFGQITKGIGGARAALLKFTAGLAALGGVAGIQRAIKGNLDFLDSIDKTSGKLGVTTKFFQQAEYAASQSGVAFGQVSTALQYIARNAYDANNGIGEAKDTFKDLKLELKDSNGQLKSTETLFREALSAISDMENEAAKVGVAMRIFGRSGVDIINMADSFDVLAEKAAAMGLVVDESIIKRGVYAKDELDTLSRIVRANLAPALVDLAPVMVGISQRLANMATWAAETWAKFVDLSNVINSLTTADDRIEELDEQIAKAREEIKRLTPEVDENASAWDRLTSSVIRAANAPRANYWKTALFLAEEERKEVLKQREELEKQFRQTAVPEVPAYQDPAKMETKTTEIIERQNKARSEALDLWREEANLIEQEWDRLSGSASASMARMVADGEISFRALGQAFVREFTERVLESLVFSRLFQLLGTAIGTAFNQSTTNYGPYQTGYQFDPAYDPLGGFRLNTEPYIPNLPTMGGNVQIINATGAPVQTQELFGGNTRVFIGQQGAQDILMGGEMAKAIETKYGVSARGVRR